MQCGLGRTGTLWAYQGYGVTPDILTAAKPLAGGLPMGAMLMTQRVADVMHPGDHGSTFAASPLVASVAEVVLDPVSDPAFLADVAAKGAYLKERLEEINSPHITDGARQGPDGRRGPGRPGRRRRAAPAIATACCSSTPDRTRCASCRR